MNDIVHYFHLKKNTHFFRHVKKFLPIEIKCVFLQIQMNDWNNN